MPPSRLLAVPLCVAIAGCPAAGSSGDGGGTESSSGGSTSGAVTTGPGDGGGTNDGVGDGGSGGTTAAGDSTSTGGGGDMGSTGGDGGPVTCPQATHQCADVVPDWTGPVAIDTAPWPDDMLGCGGMYNGADPYLGMAGLDTGTHECTCTCTPPSASGVVCNDAQLQAWTNSTCSGSPTTISLDAYNCTTTGTIAGGDYITVTAGTVWNQSSPCAPVPGQTIDTPVFGTSLIACLPTTPPDAGGCGTSQVCAPNPLRPFDGPLCIYRTGEHACPAGTEYTERTLSYSGVEDNRSCPDCTCGNTQGTCTLGTTYAFDPGSCGGAPVASFTNASCDQLAPGNTGVGINSFQGNQSPGDYFCDPDAGTTDPQGEAVPTDAVTICCIPG